MRGEYPKGGAIFLGYSPPFLRGGQISWWGESPVTKTWANSSTSLKILNPCGPSTSPRNPWLIAKQFISFDLITSYSFLLLCQA
jgi:hypothetical protein